MIKLKIYEDIFECDDVKKTKNSITGYKDGQILFELGNITDFSIVEVLEGEIPEYSEIELANQSITDLELTTIEQGQQITDLELMILGGVK